MENSEASLCLEPKAVQLEVLSMGPPRKNACVQMREVADFPWSMDVYGSLWMFMDVYGGFWMFRYHLKSSKLVIFFLCINQLNKWSETILKSGQPLAAKLRRVESDQLYPLVNIQKTMEKTTIVQWENQLYFSPIAIENILIYSQFTYSKL